MRSEAEEYKDRIAMLEDLLYKKSRERFNRGVQTKRVKSKNREMQTNNDMGV